MRIRSISIPIVIVATIAGVAAPAQLRVRGRFAVTQAAAEKAIAESLFHEDTAVPGVEVHLLTEVVASLAAAPLDVTGVKQVRPDEAGTGHAAKLLVRFSCRVRSVCVPFYGAVTVPADVALRADTMLLGSAAAAKTPGTPRTVSIVKHQVAPALRRGTHATLVLDDGRSRVELQVIALSDAKVGESVRVASLDRRHVYTARTVSAAELRGEF